MSGRCLVLERTHTRAIGASAVTHAAPRPHAVCSRALHELSSSRLLSMQCAHMLSMSSLFPSEQTESRLPPPFPAGRRPLFDAADTDGSGAVCVDEIAQITRDLKLDASSEQLARLVQASGAEDPTLPCFLPSLLRS